jgi:hypothetical protein
VRLSLPSRRGPLRTRDDRPPRRHCHLHPPSLPDTRPRADGDQAGTQIRRALRCPCGVVPRLPQAPESSTASGSVLDCWPDLATTDLEPSSIRDGTPIRAVSRSPSERCPAVAPGARFSEGSGVSSRPEDTESRGHLARGVAIAASGVARTASPAPYTGAGSDLSKTRPSRTLRTVEAPARLRAPISQSRSRSGLASLRPSPWKPGGNLDDIRPARFACK